MTEPTAHGGRRPRVPLQGWISAEISPGVPLLKKVSSTAPPISARALGFMPGGSQHDVLLLAGMTMFART